MLIDGSNDIQSYAVLLDGNRILERDGMQQVGSHGHCDLQYPYRRFVHRSKI